MAGKKIKTLAVTALASLGLGGKSLAAETPKAAEPTLEECAIVIENGTKVKKTADMTLEEYKQQKQELKEQVNECLDIKKEAYLESEHARIEEQKALGDVGREMYAEEIERRLEANKGKTIAGHSPAEAKAELVEQHENRHKELAEEFSEVDLER